MKKVAYGLLLISSLAVSYTVKAKRQKIETSKALGAQAELYLLNKQLEQAKSEKIELQSNKDKSVPKKHTRNLANVRTKIRTLEKQLSAKKEQEKNILGQIDASTSPQLQKQLQDTDSKIVWLQKRILNLKDFLRQYIPENRSSNLII